ncbi:prepilin-type N-terminal cleavage/methylation domain-containing protein [Neobacillus sp. LXY-1]|uniref:prepilin-type N-terminal cleavage/methylation domain-containing protein n=1 Tax=Neobacillus sp. LXY-1 TaxID=3379133 RepID=UPI003EE1E2FE
MKKNFHCQKGLTLIEVLISILILAIILLSFMGFFTQSALFTKKNEQKLDTLQIAQKIVNLVEVDITKQDLLANGIIDSNGSVLNSPKTIDASTLNLLLDDTIDPNYKYSAVVSNNSSQNLIMFKIIVQDPRNLNNKSETYTYIRR